MSRTATKYFSLIPSEFKLDGGAMFGIIPKPLWQKKIPCDDINRINMALRVVLIKTPLRLIMIDSGIGDYHDQVFNQRHNINPQALPLNQLLERLHYQADQVTDIIPSHLHFDHVGGFFTLDDQEKVMPLFPNACLHLHRQHFQYSLNSTPRDTGSFQKKFFKPFIEYYQFKQQINWLDQKQGKILNDKDYQLNYLCSFGHTPYQVHPYDHKMLFLADLTPTSAHLSAPWVMGYDMQPGLTSQEKTQFYQFAHEKQLKLIFDHDLDFWGAELAFDSSGRQAFYAEELFSQQSPFQELTAIL